MNLKTSLASCPLWFFILVAFVLIIVPVSLMEIWKTKAEKDVKLLSNSLHQQILYGIENTAKVYAPFNSSAQNLAKILNASFDGSRVNSFSKLESMVAPSMFEALSTIPHVSQVSYIGVDGLFFAYYIKPNQQHVALYSNSSVFTMYSSYVQPVNPDTGELYGTAVQYRTSFISNISLFINALNSTNGYTSLGTAWTDDHDLMFLNSVGVQGKGVISLGFRVKSVMSSFSGILNIKGSLYVATKDGTLLNEGIPYTQIVFVTDHLVSLYVVHPCSECTTFIGNITCDHKNDGSFKALKIFGDKYLFYCAPLQILGVESVYVLALQDNRLQKHIHFYILIISMLLLIMCCVVLLAILCFGILICRAINLEMRLQAALIKEKEVGREIEKRGMKKSIAFATASHDIRASLAGIKGLIDICRHQVPLKSELDSRLLQMETCSNDLLEILNSILDSSKIEAGKMQLQIEEFDIVELVENVVDLFYSVGIKKGVDVMLDMCDGSITKFSRVKGDHGKLKQILSNLLSNAVKFTSEGYVSVRAWAREARCENPVLSFTKSNSVKCSSCLSFKTDGVSSEVEYVKKIQKDPNGIEFIFEVNDTGKGIPKEKHKSVFENYIQVKDTDLAQEGTGLGLAIVQNLVWLMEGEIKIVEKEVGEKGTCFRFNVFLICNNDENEQSDNNAIIREDGLESIGGYISSDSYQHRTPSTRLFSPWLEGSHVVLYIQNEERCKISRKFMERRGVKVSAVTNCEQLSATLKRIKNKLLKRSSSSGRTDPGSRSNSSGGSKEVPLSSLDGTDEVAPSLILRRNSCRVTNFILIVLDASVGPFKDLCRVIADFRRDMRGDCNRVVYLDKPGANYSLQIQGLDNHKLPPQDLILTKPFHGSCLNQVIGLLPEFGGVMPPKHKMKLEEIERIWGRDAVNEHKLALDGKKVLLVEDSKVLCRIACTQLSRLGASVDYCGNGEEAVGLIVNGLKDQRTHRASQILPYDYIFMDCQMPIMNGYEATRMIRREEESYGVRIPIIALTAHETGEETDMIMEAGMDFHLSKPLKEELLLEAIAHIDKRRMQQ